MTTKYGVFLEPGYLVPGGEPGKKGPHDERHAGLNFKSPVPKNGKTNDATFDKFKPLFEGEKYIESGRAQQQAAKAAKKTTPVADRPFKCTSPMKRSSGLGDFAGTIGGKVEYISEPPHHVSRKGEVKHEHANIMTSPSKLGTFGFNKTCLGQLQNTKGVCGEYEWLADPYQAAAARAETGSKKAAEVPFKPPNPPKAGTFGMPGLTLGGPHGKGVVGEYEYVVEGAQAKQQSKKIDVPFKPASFPKSGYSGSLSKFPEYLAEPEKMRIEAAAGERKVAREKLASQNPWKPNTYQRTDMTRSIVRMNI